MQERRNFTKKTFVFLITICMLSLMMLPSLSAASEPAYRFPDGAVPVDVTLDGDREIAALAEQIKQEI